MAFQLVDCSKNSKTGPIALVTAGDDTCNPDCPFLGNCYPRRGRLAIHWRKVTNGERGASLSEIVDRIAALPAGRVVRWGDAGDLPTTAPHSGTVDLEAVRSIAKAVAKRGKRGFAYTHADPTLNANTIESTNRESKSFTVNLSAAGVAQAEDFASRKIAPVVTVLHSAKVDPDWRKLRTSTGRSINRCPAEYLEGFQCANCGGAKGPICAQKTRKHIVGFTAHSGPKKVNAAIDAVEASYQEGE
jgi:hypothetical protein